jgi:hypothetical protein
VAKFFSLRGSAVHALAFASLCKLGLDATTFGVVLGAGVEFAVDEAEEFGEVGRWPTLDPIKERNDSRHFWNQFTYENAR